MIGGMAGWRSEWEWCGLRGSGQGPRVAVVSGCGVVGGGSGAKVWCGLMAGLVE